MAPFSKAIAETLQLLRNAKWLDRAACNNPAVPSSWFLKPAKYGEAIQVCHTCPVKDECLKWALDMPEETGVWGGYSPAQRWRIRRGKPPGPVGGGLDRPANRHDPVPKVCASCDNPIPAGSRSRHGWCGKCYTRWFRAGKPEGGPPAMAAEEQKRERMDRIVEMWNKGFSVRRIAQLTGLSTSGAYKYVRELKDAGKIGER